jgi:hypothetical protein
VGWTKRNAHLPRDTVFSSEPFGGAIRRSQIVFSPGAFPSIKGAAFAT